MVLNGPLGVAGGRPNGWLAKGGVADAEYAELSGQAIQIQADSIKIGVGGTPRKRGSNRILCRGVLRDGLTKRAVGRRQ